MSGATGSGKTTLTKGLVLEIPSDERLIVLEDAAELSLSSHPNSVRLLYSKEGQGLARVSAKQLLEASLRMRPDRILLAELRGRGGVLLPAERELGAPGVDYLGARVECAARVRAADAAGEGVAGRDESWRGAISARCWIS